MHGFSFLKIILAMCMLATRRFSCIACLIFYVWSHAWAIQKRHVKRDCCAPPAVCASTRPAENGFGVGKSRMKREGRGRGGRRKRADGRTEGGPRHSISAKDENPRKERGGGGGRRGGGEGFIRRRRRRPFQRHQHLLPPPRLPPSSPTNRW